MDKTTKIYKIAVFTIVLIALSIVTAVGSFIWNGGRKGDRVGLEKGPAVDLKADKQLLVYNEPSVEWHGAVEADVEKKHIYNTNYKHKYAVFNSPLVPDSNSDKLFDVDKPQEIIAPLFYPSRGHSPDPKFSPSYPPIISGSPGGGSPGGGSPPDDENSSPPDDFPFTPDPDPIVGPPIPPHDKGEPNSVNPVPEPATLLLFGVGLVSLASYRLKRKKS